MRHPYFDLPRPTILGHRGAGGVAPENTLAAFACGLEQGAHIIESDVHGTRDGVPVLLHDPSVDRTTNGDGVIADLSLAQVQALDAGHHFTGNDENVFPFRGKGLTIPTLMEAFESFPEARFNLEIKAESPELMRAVVELVSDSRREEHTLLTAGDDHIMASLRQQLGRSGAKPAVGASVADIVTVVRSAQQGTAPETDCMALQIPREFAGQPLVTRELVDHCHRHDIELHVWTINDADEMRELLDLGVDGLVTDFPGRLAELLARSRD